MLRLRHNGVCYIWFYTIYNLDSGVLVKLHLEGSDQILVDCVNFPDLSKKLMRKPPCCDSLGVTRQYLVVPSK